MNPYASPPPPADSDPNYVWESEPPPPGEMDWWAVLWIAIAGMMLYLIAG